MSAFLGPIHVKMYERVLYQDAMSRALLDFAAEKGCNGNLSAEVDSHAPAASTQPLEDIIDAGNIHGWLSEAVARCERRFALTVFGILDGHPERVDDLRGVIKAMGERRALPPEMDAERAFQAVHDILLDGMPCDFPFATTEASADAVAWQVTNCPHAPYWKDGACGVEVYYQLRDAWMNGALSQSGIQHSRPALYSHVMKRECGNG